MVRTLDQGESVAVAMMDRLGPARESVRAMAYRLYHVCEQRAYSQEAQAYNALVQSWTEISQLTREIKSQHAATSSGELKQYDDR